MKIEFSRSWLIPGICLIITAYFAWHTVQGARGYRRMHQVRAEIVLARQIAEETRQHKELLARKVQALSPTSLDRDLLEESAMKVLNMASEKDLIILLTEDGDKTPTNK